ncbi:hypothetical protein AVEN_96246-1 [Araneus ventricosus]|uniref:Uncharacterized protein n=1 Tax=Araneus ventricosus TaxID=182803 RepID=A0A4Y2M8L2_ARAVE|nr:hypothetical protein AVEN_96246-1 [Araneus ventricosus]
MIDTGNRNIIYYQTARANVVGSNKIIREIRILIDSGSETSFLLESIAEEVGLPTVSIEKLKIHTFESQTPHLRELKKKRVLLKDPNSGSQLKCNILVIDKIVGVDLIRIPSKGIASVLRQEGFVLSDQGSEDTEIGLLIGNDLINEILTGKTCRLSDNLMLYETIFGWVINGSSRGESASNCTLSMCTIVECCEEERLSDLLYNWFQLESLGINDSLSGRSETDEKIIQKFEENLRFENGRYVTGLL